MSARAMRFKEVASPLGMLVADAELERSERVAAVVTALRDGSVVSLPDVSVPVPPDCGRFNLPSVTLKPPPTIACDISRSHHVGVSQVPT